MNVSDSSPVIIFAKYDELALLRRLWTKIVIPEAVYREITPSRIDARGVEAIQRATSRGFLQVVSVRNRELADSLKTELGDGEAEAIALTLENSGSILLIEDKEGRGEAEARGVKCLGILGLLKQAKLSGSIPAVRPIVEDLLKFRPFWSRAVQQKLYSDVQE